jgi:flagellin
MTSLNTNSAAMTALQTLTTTMKSLETTQGRIATGLRVGSAADNAAYWSIATTMRSDNMALSAVQDSLNLGASMIDVAYTGINKSLEVVGEIKSKLVAATQPGVDRGKIQAEIGELQKQLRSVADSAVFSGQNWLAVNSASAGYNANKSIVASFSRGATGASVSTIDVNTAATKLFDANGQAGILDTVNATTTVSVATLNISALTDSAADLTRLGQIVAQVDDAIGSMTNAASNLGAVKGRVGMQQSFITSLRDSIDKGIGALVDADMNRESTRLQALQVQQQLGVQALSIANSSSQSILSLFRG